MTYNAQFYVQGPRMEVAGVVVVGANAIMLLVLAAMGWRCACAHLRPPANACPPARCCNPCVPRPSPAPG
jgi:hypothetical protein